MLLEIVKRVPEAASFHWLAFDNKQKLTYTSGLRADLPGWLAISALAADGWRSGKGNKYWS